MKKKNNFHVDTCYMVIKEAGIRHHGVENSLRCSLDCSTTCIIDTFHYPYRVSCTRKHAEIDERNISEGK